MKTLSLFAMLFLFSKVSLSVTIPTDSLFLSQTPPGGTPKIFNLHISPSPFTAERIAISNDGTEIYYTVLSGYYPTTGDTIKYYKFNGNQWTGPFNLFNGFLAPALSLTGDTIYFQNNIVPYQMLYSVRNGTTWSTPQRFLYGLNSAHYFQVTNFGNHFISSVASPGEGASDWCRLRMIGTDTTAITLGKPVSTALDNLDFYIAKDESFIILASSHLYVSFQKSNGDWSNPKDLGTAINFGSGMWGPYVTSDNKYLFYSTGTNPNYSDVRVYWVRVDSIMNKLKNSNFIPYLKKQIPNQTDTVSHLFNYTVPDSTFIDDDGNNTLSYTASLYNGNPLPSWLNFNPTTRTFYGTPTANGTLQLKVTVTDTAGATAFCAFTLFIRAHVSVNGRKEVTPTDYILFQNYPNPFNPNTIISYSLVNRSFVNLKLYDILGKEIATLVKTTQQNGTYDFSLNMSNYNLSSGIYYYSISINEISTGKFFKDTKAMSYLK